MEESLLLDILSAFIDVFAKSSNNPGFQPGAEIARSEIPLELHGTEEFCKIGFTVNKAGDDKSSQADVYISCSKLEPLVTPNAVVDDEPSAEDIEAAMLTHVQQVAIPITAQLASATLNFEQIMSLKANDILLLNKGIDEPVELIVENRALFRGNIAQTSGKYAVVVTEPVDQAT